MEKGGFNVVLFEVPIEGRREVRDGAERLEPGSGRGHLIIVDAILLCVPFHDIPDLIADYFASVVPLLFAHEFALQGAGAAWHFRSRDKDEHLQCFETAYLIMSSGDPIFPFGRAKGLVPFRLILQVRLKGAVRYGGDKVWYGGSISGRDIEGQEIVRVAKRGKFSKEGMNRVHRTVVPGCSSAGTGGRNVRDCSSEA